MLARARKLVDGGESARAVAVLQEARKASAGGPSEPAVLLELGRAYAAQQERTYALEAFDAVLTRFPKSDLAGEAQNERALLELGGLPTAGDVLEAMRSFATFNPLSLDPDAINHFFGVEKGYHLDHIGTALEELQKTWSEHPASPRAPEALLRQSAIEGFLTSERKLGLEHLQRLLHDYAKSKEAATGRLFTGFLQLLEGETKQAAASFASVPPDAGAAPFAEFFAGLSEAYMLGDLAAGQPHFAKLEKAGDVFWRELGAYHSALLAFARTGQTLDVKAHLAPIGKEPASPRIATWKRALERTLERVDHARADDDRRLAMALFWKDAGHTQRAISELKELLRLHPSGETAPQAKLELGRLQADEAVEGKGREAFEEAARAHPMPERALEARWRAREDATVEARGKRPAPRLEGLARDGEVWRSRAVAELARRAGDDPVARGRLLRQLDEAVSAGAASAEETRKRSRDLGDFLAGAHRYRAALDVYRRLLPEDPQLREKMIGLAALEAMAELDKLVAAEKTKPTRAPFDKLRAKGTSAAASAKVGVEGTADAGSALVARAVTVAESLLAAGERQAAVDLLERAGASSGGGAARVRRLVLSLEEGPITLASLGKINAMMEEKGLAEADRLRLIEWKARVLEQQKVETAKALDLYRYLVAHGHRVAELSVLLAERVLAGHGAKGPQDGAAQAMTLLAKVPRSAHRDLVEARALQELKQPDVCRDRLVQIVSKYPSGPDVGAAVSMLAEQDGARLVEAAAFRGTVAPGKDPGVVWKDDDVDRLLARLVPGEAVRMGAALNTLVAALATGSGGVSPQLLDRLIAIYEALPGPSAAGRLGDLHRLRIESGRASGAGDALGLARAMAGSGRAREAFDLLEGKGAEASLEQVRLLKVELKDPTRALERLRRLARDGKLPAGVRGRAAAELASWRRGEKDEAEALELSAKANPASTAAADAHERLAALALVRGDKLSAAQHHEAAARARPGEPRARRLALAAAREWLDAGKPDAASRLAQALLTTGASEDVPEQARSILALAAGRAQLDGLQRSLDRDDPANPGNLPKLLSIAHVQAEMLDRPDEAETTLVLLSEQYPDQAALPELAALRKTIALRRAVARQEERGGPGLVLAGLLRESEGADARGAALDYSRAVTQLDGKGPLALLARLYLARVSALFLDDAPRAARLLDEAASQPEADRFAAMIETGRACVQALTAAGRGHPGLQLARAAAGPLQDPAFLAVALAGQKPSAETAQLALESASSIDPLRTLTPLGPDTTGRLELAIALAPTGEARARAKLALADWHRERGDPERALALYAEAAGDAAGGPLAALADARRGEVLENEMKDSGGAVEAYRAASLGGRGPFQEIAAARLPLVLARRDADAADASASRGAAARQPEAYLQAARAQAKIEGQLDRAVESYRTFLRTFTDGKLLGAAYRELAEALVRADRPREAVETLARLLDRRLPGVTAAAVLLRMGAILEQNLADLAEATRFYDEVKRVAPETAEAKGASEGLKRIAEAGKASERAEKTGESEGNGGEELAVIRKKYLSGVKDPAGAVEALKAQIPISRDPAEKAALYTELARVEANQLKDFQAASDSYEQAVALEGKSDTAALLTLEWATLLSEKLKAPKRAMELYDEWLKKFYSHPKKVAVMLERARLMEAALDNAQGAIDVYRYIANAHPRSGFDEAALLRIAQLSRTYFANHQGAVDAYDQIARRFPFGPNAQTALFQAAQISEIELGDLDRAVGFYNRLVATYPTSPLANDARNALARIERRRR